MSNIHTLSDTNRNNDVGPAYGRIAQGQNNMGGMAPMDEESVQAMSMYGSLVGMGGNNIGKAPR